MYIYVYDDHKERESESETRKKRNDHPNFVLKKNMCVCVATAANRKKIMKNHLSNQNGSLNFAHEPRFF